MLIRPSHWSHDRGHFFKYLNASTGKIVLKNRTLRWSTPALLNDPFDMQFDLHVTLDRAAVKAAPLEKLWNSFYGDNPPRPNNQLGEIISAFKGLFPILPREAFNMKFGGAIDEGFERAQTRLPQFHDGIRKLMAEGKILCLSEIQDNLLMWSHYAGQHTGLVLRMRCVPELDSAWGAAKPVEYLDQMPRLHEQLCT